MNFASVTLVDSQLIGNQANGQPAERVLGEGGAIALYLQVQASIVRTTFKGNSAADEGGAISLVSCSSVTMNAVTFVTNVVMAEGGAIYIAGREQALVFITNATFSSNGAGGDGGGIYVEGRNTQLIINDASFTDNGATNGAAIAISTATGVTCLACHFKDNVAQTAGGAFLLNAIYPCAILLQSGSMIHNKAECKLCLRYRLYPLNTNHCNVLLVTDSWRCNGINISQLRYDHE
jgi:predicted outer membrane repeat protein